MRQYAIGVRRPGQDLPLRSGNQGNPGFGRPRCRKARVDAKGEPEKRRPRTNHARTRDGHIPPPTRRHLEDLALHGLRGPRPDLRKKNLSVSDPTMGFTLPWAGVTP